MRINKGNSLFENAYAVASEKNFIRYPVEEKILIVEGQDDIRTLKNYYYYINGTISYRVITASSEDDSIYNVDGKKNLIELYNVMKSQNSSVVCLMDRDYDFYLSEQLKTDQDVLYYDYFELENYLFEEQVLKVVVKNFSNNIELSDYNDIINILNEIEIACREYIILCFFREVNYRENLLNSEKVEKLIKIINTKPSSMMEMNNIQGDSKLNKINKYIEIKLEEMSLTVEYIKNQINKDHYHLINALNSTSHLNYFKYMLKGKLLVNCLPYFLGYAIDKLEKKNDSNGDISGLKNKLKNELIPMHSTKYKELIQQIETRFKHPPLHPPR